MNITVNETLPLNRANMMKLRKASSIISDSSMPKPEDANNMAFQGATVKPAVKAATVLATFIAPSIITSCIQYPDLERGDVTINNSVTVDLSMWNEMIAALKAELQQSRQQDSIQHANDAARDSAYHAETMQILNLIYNADDSTKQTILKFWNEYLEGGMTFADFKDILLAMEQHLANIEKNMAHMDSVMTAHAGSFNNFVEKYDNDQINLNARYDNFEKNDSVLISEVIEIKNLNHDMKINVEGMKISGDSLYALLANNHGELMDTLKNRLNGGENGDVTINALRIMLGDYFDELNLNIDESTDSLLANVNRIWQEYKQAKDEEIANNDAKYDSLMVKLDGIFGKLGDIDQNITDQGAKMAGKVDTVNININNFINEYKAGNDSIAALIKEFKNASTERQDTIIARIESLENTTKAGLDSLKASTAEANVNLAEMRDSIAPALELLRELRNDGNNNYQNFVQLLAERDSANHTNYFIAFNNTLAALGLDSIAENVKDIKTIEDAINNKFDLVQSIFDFISGIDYDNLDADVIAKLQEMFDFLKTHNFCNCNCGNNNNQNNHEGILDNLDNAFADNVARRVNQAAARFLNNHKDNTYIVTDLYA